MNHVRGLEKHEEPCSLSSHTVTLAINSKGNNNLTLNLLIRGSRGVMLKEVGL